MRLLAQALALLVSRLPNQETLPNMSTTAALPATSTPSGAKPQGGIIEGLNPIHYNPKDPISLFIVQVRGTGCRGHDIRD